MADELFFNVRLEGSTKFTPADCSPGCPEGEVSLSTVVLIEAGLSSWQDDPFRATIVTSYLDGDADDKSDERKFPTSEELCTWLETYITDLRARGFTTVRYKANGMPIDWLNRINLPPD
jgi:hypothetical protein